MDNFDSDNESENSFMNEDAMSEYSYGDVSQKNSDDESDTHSEISVEDKKERKERRKKRTQDDGNSVFMRNIPLSVNKETIQAELEKFGKLKRVTIISKENWSTKQCLAQYENFGSFKDATNEKIKVGGQIVKILPKEKKETKIKPKSQDALQKKTSREETSLYLSNLPATTTEEDIRAKFNQFGEVSWVKILPNKKSALIGFERQEDCQKALNQQEILVRDRLIKISPREKKETKLETKLETGLDKEPTQHPPKEFEEISSFSWKFRGNENVVPDLAPIKVIEHAKTLISNFDSKTFYVTIREWEHISQFLNTECSIPASLGYGTTRYEMIVKMTIFGETDDVFELYKSVLKPFFTQLELSSLQIDYLKRFKKDQVDSVCIKHNILIEASKSGLELKSSHQPPITISIQDTEPVRSAILQMTELKSMEILKNFQIPKHQVFELEQKYSVLFIPKSKSHWLVYGSTQKDIKSTLLDYSLSSSSSSSSSPFSSSSSFFSSSSSSSSSSSFSQDNEIKIPISEEMENLYKKNDSKLEEIKRRFDLKYLVIRDGKLILVGRSNQVQNAQQYLDSINKISLSQKMLPISLLQNQLSKMFPNDVFKIQKNNNTILVDIWSFDSQAIQEYLSKIREYRKTFPLSGDQKKFVQENLSRLRNEAQKYSSAIFFNDAQNLEVVALSFSDRQNAFEAIKKIVLNAKVNETLDCTQPILFYFQKKPQQFKEFEKQNDVSVALLESKSQISIKGLLKDVQRVKTEILQFIKSIIFFEHSYSLPNPECYKVLQNKLKIRLAELQTPTLLVHILEKDQKVLLASIHKTELDDAKKRIQLFFDLFKERKIKFSDNSSFKNLLSTKKISLPKISQVYVSNINIPDHADYILIYGLEEDFQGIKDFIENLIKETSIKIIRKHFSFPDPAIKFCIEKKKDHEIKNIVTQHQFKYSWRPNGLILDGDEKNIQALELSLKAFIDKEKLLISSINTKFDGILFNYVQTEQKNLLYETCNKFFVWYEVPSFSFPKIDLIQGNIIDEKSSILVNAANNELLLGGGVAGAIASHGGPDIQNECKKIVASRNGRINAGEAIVTGSGKLKVDCIIHAVAPRWGIDEEPGKKLRAAIENSLSIAIQKGAKSISLPALGCGTFQVPAKFGAAMTFCTAFKVLSQSQSSIQIRVVINDPTTFQEFSKVFQEIQDTILPLQSDHQQNKIQEFIQKYEEDFRIVKKAQVSSHWSWKDDGGKNWIPYDTEIDNEIEKSYQDKKPSFSFNVKNKKYSQGQQYVIDFQAMVQLNQATNFSRKIKRNEIQDIQSVQEEMKNLKVESSITHIILRGYTEDLMRCQPVIQEILDKLWFEDSIKNLGYLSPSQIDSLIDACLAFDVRGEFKDGVLTLGGIENAVHKTKSQLYDKISAIKDSISDLNPPSTWVLQETNLHLEPILKDSEEWLSVSKKFNETMSSTITSITRIQNQLLWRKYTSARNRLKEKLQKDPPELQLFHGTSKTDPVDVYNGEVGFDMRFSRKGMWGEGSYFAEKASYSHNYTFSSPQGKQMFFASVLVGDYVTMPSDSSLRMPPEKPTNDTGLFHKPRYDSVSGNTGGSNVWIIYDNDKAYPSYLITYE